MVKGDRQEGGKKTNCFGVTRDGFFKIKAWVCFCNFLVAATLAQYFTERTCTSAPFKTGGRGRATSPASGAAFVPFPTAQHGGGWETRPSQHYGSRRGQYAGEEM